MTHEDRIKAPGSTGESEITNRTIHQKTLQEALKRSDLTKDELKSAIEKLWALKGRTDLIRRTAYFRSDEVMNDSHALLDEDGGVPVAFRISDFVEAAATHGYSPETGEDLTLPAQFASVVLSSRWPDRFVDFRKRRWNDLYREVMQSKSAFLRSDPTLHSSYTIPVSLRLSSNVIDFTRPPLREVDATNGAAVPGAGVASP